MSNSFAFRALKILKNASVNNGHARTVNNFLENVRDRIALSLPHSPQKSI